ncbi:MAG: hypothetical protein CL910_20895 [Deltaproteobacteria bacterium]|jgi:arylsulfatase A-like enzyme|nr:hypothetical protein [Deltaproteobacteria bacterium]
MAVATPETRDRRQRIARRILLALALAGGALACKAPAVRPNVVFVLVDTLRKDHLGLYGYPLRTSETIDALGRGGWVFEKHIAHASQTVPSTLSMMLSRLPVDHGFAHRRIRQFSDRPPRFPDEFLFLTEVFREAGYATAAAVGNRFLSHKTGFSQGFEFFFQAKVGDKLTAASLRWLEARRTREDERPVFLYVHYVDAHYPYVDPKEHPDRVATPASGRLLFGNGLVADIAEADLAFTRASYDAGVATVDDEISKLVAYLEERGIFEDTIFVVTSDHGEEFDEHGGLGHGTTVYGEQVRIPLVVSHPRELEAGRRITRPTQHLDLAPTLLRWAGIPVPEAFRGQDLLGEERPILADNGVWRAVHAGSRKLILNTETGEEVVYALDDELDRSPVEGPVASDLREALAAYLQQEDAGGTGPSSAEEWSEEEKEQLRALGYLE